MKKLLSMMLVLVMVASLVAIPAMAEVTEDYAYIPYKTETFARFRNAFSTNPATANMGLSVNNAVGVNPDELPIYGDSALIGVHEGGYRSGFVTTEDVNSNADGVAAAEMAIIADPDSTANGSNRAEKMLKLSCSNGSWEDDGTRSVSFGFVPNDVLAQADGIYFEWDQKVVSDDAGSWYILQWVDENGLGVRDQYGGNYIYSGAVGYSDDVFETHRIEIVNDRIYLDGDDDLLIFDKTNPPEGAVGVKLVVEYARGNFTTYIKNLEVGTIGGNFAALRGDALAYSHTATEVVVDFSAPVVDGAENVLLYNNNVAVEGAEYAWNADNTVLTITAPEALGAGKGYRVSTSKAYNETGSILNDVRFITTLKFQTTAVVAPNVFDLYDLNGNKFNTASVVDGNDITITMFLNEGEEAPKAVVPYFTYEGDATGFNPDFAYNFVLGDDTFTSAIRGIYPILNGATAIPVKDFVLFQGGNQLRNASYNVSIVATEVPENVTSEIAAGEDELTEVGLLTPVTVTFSHGISAEGQAAVEITENGEAFDACITEWSIDGTELTITPDPLWTLGAEYVITVPEDASIFGEVAPVIAEGLTFTATSEIPGEEFVDTFELTNESLIYTFDAASKTVAIIVKTEEEVDLTAVEFNATVTGVASFLEIDAEAVEAVDGVYTATLDISDALGASNAVTFAVDNGFGVDTEYSVYYVEATNPPTVRVELGTVETFDNGTVGERFTGDNIIGSSGLGSYGVVSHSAGNATHNAKVVEEGENKFLRITSNTKGSSWVGLSSVAVPRSFYQNASKLVFSYDVRQNGDAANGRAGVGGAATTTSAAGGAGQKSDTAGIALFASGGWKTWFAQGSFTRDPNTISFLKQVSPSTIHTSTTEWKNVEWILENAVVPAAADRADSYEGTIGTTLLINSKAPGDAEWTVGTTSEVAAWNFKNDNYLRFYITHDGNNAEKIADFDNFRIYALTQDLATEVTLESGENIAVGEKVDILFKTPLMTGQEANFIIKDAEGNEVGYDYSWSDDRLTLSLIPDVEANKIYTLTSTELSDVYGNAITVNATVPVLPDVEVFEYVEDGEYEIIPGDYSQTVNVVYKHNVAGRQEIDLKFTFGSSSTRVRGIKVDKPEAGTNYTEISVVIPNAVVKSGEETVGISVITEIEMDILGFYFVDGMNIDDINAVETEADALEILNAIAESMGEEKSFEKLVERVQDDFAAELLAKLEEGEFESLDEVKEWFTDELEVAIENNPKPDRDPDKGGSSGGGGSYVGGSSYTPTPSETATTLNQFTDLGQAAWAKTAINTLYAAGIVKGISKTEYAPLKDVTREEFTKLIVELFGIYDPYIDSSFDDVASDAWYNPYIASAQQAGIVAGISEDEFGVGQSITREQMATMLKRACDKYGVSLNGVSSTTFKDEGEISGYAAASVEALAKAGIINGIDGSFAPKQVANRAMAAQVVYLVYLRK